VRVHALADASSERTTPHHGLHAPCCITLLAIALEEPTAAAINEMGTQLLRERRQYRDVPVGVALCMRDVNLRRIVVQEEIFHTDMNELAHPCTG
jgi:hypothetical protein